MQEPFATGNDFVERLGHPFPEPVIFRSSLFQTAHSRGLKDADRIFGSRIGREKSRASDHRHLIAEETLVRRQVHGVVQFSRHGRSAGSHVGVG